MIKTQVLANAISLAENAGTEVEFDDFKLHIDIRQKTKEHSGAYPCESKARQDGVDNPCTHPPSDSKTHFAISQIMLNNPLIVHTLWRLKSVILMRTRGVSHDSKTTN